MLHYYMRAGNASLCSRGDFPVTEGSWKLGGTKLAGTLVTGYSLLQSFLLPCDVIARRVFNKVTVSKHKLRIVLLINDRRQLIINVSCNM